MRFYVVRFFPVCFSNPVGDGIGLDRSPQGAQGPLRAR